MQGKSVKRINTKDELEKYKIEGKWNDYIGLQKEIINVLRSEGYFDIRSVINEESGMNVRITAKGIKETLGNRNRFQNLPKRIKVYKVATIRHIPSLIKNGYIIADNVDNIHEEGGYKFAYIGNEVVIDNESVRIRIAVKKKIGSNHFWIHNIDEYKNDSELLGPSRKTENKETQSRINTIS